MALLLKIDGKLADRIYSVSGKIINPKDKKDERKCSLIIQKGTDDRAVLVIREDLKKSLINGEPVMSISQPEPFEVPGYRAGTEIETSGIFFSYGKPAEPKIIRTKQILK